MTARQPNRPAPGALWIGGRVRTGLTVFEPTPAALEVVLWFDVTRDQIVAARAVAADAEPAALADQLRDALARHAHWAPRHIRVATLADARLITAAARSAAVEIGPIPELERLAREIAVSLPRDEPGRGSTTSPIDPRRTGAFFASMARIWRAEPWRDVDSNEPLELDVMQLDVFGACVSVMGSTGVGRGLMVFDSYEDLELAFAMAPVDETRARERYVPRVHSLGLLFMPAADVGEPMRALAAAHGWRVADPDAWPMLVRIDADGRLRPVDARDLAIGYAIAAGVASFWRQHRRSLRGRAAGLLHTCVMTGPGRATQVDVRFPHGLSDDGGREPASDWQANDSAEQAEARLHAFLDSPELARVPAEAWIGAEAVVRTLHVYKIRVVDGWLDGIRAPHVASFMLAFVPRFALLEPAVARQLPEILRVYFTWLAERGYEPAEAMKLARERLERHRASYQELVFDESRYSRDKVLALQRRRAQSRSQPERGRSAARVPVGPSHAPADGGAGGSVSGIEVGGASAPLVRPRRWFPVAGEPAPASGDACPCGSGRTYGKCCMVH